MGCPFMKSSSKLIVSTTQPSQLQDKPNTAYIFRQIGTKKKASTHTIYRNVNCFRE